MQRFNFTSSGVFTICQGERDPISAVWWQGHQRGPGAEPLVKRSGGEPPEAKTLSFQRSMKVANLPTFLIFGKAENHALIFRR